MRLSAFFCILLAVFMPTQATETLLHGSIDKIHAQARHLLDSQPDSAMKYYITVAGKYNSHLSETDKRLCADALLQVGKFYYAKESYPEACEMFFNGIKICEENGFTDIAANFYINIGNIYSIFDDNILAIRFYTKGLDAARQSRNKILEIKLLINITGVYALSGQIAQAKAYYDTTMSYKNDFPVIGYYEFLNLAVIETSQNDYEHAVPNFLKAVRCADSLNLDPQYKISSYGELARLYIKTGNIDSALHYYHINAELAEKHQRYYLLNASLMSLASLYEKTGNKAKAEYYQTRYHHLSDSFLNIYEFNKLKNAQFIYEIDKQYKEIAALAKEKEEKEAHIRQQRCIILSISGGMLIFGFLLTIVYLQKKRLNRTYDTLFAHTQEIIESDRRNRQTRNFIEQRYAELEQRSKTLEQQLHACNSADTGSHASENTGNCTTCNDSASSGSGTSVDLDSQQIDAILSKILHIMEDTDEFCNPDFSIQNMAALTGSNRSYVSFVINKSFNKNFRTFLNQYRIKEACARLSDVEHYGQLTINAIAESVGYRSQSAFISIFKKITGITPSKYQKIASDKQCARQQKPADTAE